MYTQRLNWGNGVALLFWKTRRSLFSHTKPLGNVSGMSNLFVNFRVPSIIFSSFRVNAMRVYSKSYRTRRNGTADRGKSIRHLRAAAAAAAARVEVLLVSKAVLLLRLHTATAPAAVATTNYYYYYYYQYCAYCCRNTAATVACDRRAGADNACLIRSSKRLITPVGTARHACEILFRIQPPVHSQQVRVR